MARLAYVISEVAATLAALHDAAFVHGDLKPEHVRVTADERVLVLDLGSALARSPSECAAPEPVALTPAFAAPGGARRRAPDARVGSVFIGGAELGVGRRLLRPACARKSCGELPAGFRRVLPI